jgi:ribosomal protein L31E
MSNSLADLLSNKDFDEPNEMRAIKQFVQKHYQVDVEVQIRDKELIVTTPSAALANTLRLKMPELRKVAATDKKIVLRIR